MPREYLLYDDAIFNSRLSFQPLINVLRKDIAEGKPGAQRLYGDLIVKMEATPELLTPFSEFTPSEAYNEIIEMLLAILFPPSVSEQENIYAVSFPFRLKAIHSSRLFQAMFLKSNNGDIIVPENVKGSMHQSRLEYAYRLILQKVFGYPVPDNTPVIYPYVNPETGVTRYLQLNLDTRFVEVKLADGVPELPPNVICKKTNRLMPLEELMEKLPLKKFVFEGLVIVKIIDVTEQELISQIKNTLLSIHTFTDASVHDKLQLIMKNLLGMSDIKVGITPLIQMNNRVIYSSLYNRNSIIFKHRKAVQEQDRVSDFFQDLLKGYEQPILFETLDKRDIVDAETLKLYYELGARTLIVCPLRENGHLLGVLEIISDKSRKLSNIHLARIEKAIPLFTLAIEKMMEVLEIQVDKVIKENFTAVQPAVEWRFVEAALSYILSKEQGSNAKVEKVSFNEVHPLYGLIDVQNSSVERMQAIQLDLVEQLMSVQKVVKKALAEAKFPLLENILFKTNKYIDSVTDILLSEEELQIHEFLQNDVAEIFYHLADTRLSLKKEVDEYFAALDAHKNLIYHHRQYFEESISKLNDALVKFIDQEQINAQEVFPHYFDRYVTDGVDFNIYIGQSIAPTKKFHKLYLRNMKIWQLDVLARAAVIANEIKNKLPIPLMTTQLILANSVPISISFRSSERKFDVDGTYNSRYEIVKKRIDKVRIKGTQERLTQPGKIAIVYSQPKEAAEYEEYIEFLQTRQLLKPGVEKIELEELQGVLGLKALRVEVNYDNNTKPEFKNPELSSLTSNQLIG
jgi:hypothetical protein